MKIDIVGIYQIRNLINNKLYIGSSVRIKHRWAVHRSLLRRGRHHSQILQRAWNKYGEASFSLEILEECARDKPTLMRRENHSLMTLLPEYNVSKEAISNLGRIVPAEMRARMKAAHASRGANAEQWKKNISVATQGPRGPRKPTTRAHALAISAAKKGCVSPMKGRTFSAEHKERIAAAQRGKPRPYADMSAARNWFKTLPEDERAAFHARRGDAIRAAKRANREAATA